MNRERLLKAVLVVVGLIFVFAVYPLHDVFVAERLAMAAQPTGIRADDPSA